MRLKNTFIVKKIVKSTSAEMFKYLIVGDTIEMHIDLKPLGSNRGVSYSAYITVRCPRLQQCVSKSLNQLKVLDNFIMEEINENDKDTKKVN